MGYVRLSRSIAQLVGDFDSEDEAKYAESSYCPTVFEYDFV